MKYHVKADLDHEVIELHVFKDGYCGISKVEGENRYCICYLTTAKNLQQDTVMFGEKIFTSGYPQAGHFSICFLMSGSFTTP